MGKYKTVQLSVDTHEKLIRLKDTLEKLTKRSLDLETIIIFLLESKVDWADVFSYLSVEPLE